MLAPAQPLIETETDQSLLRRCASEGDHAAMSEIIRRYAGLVFGAARRQSRSEDLADDISQTVWIIFARRAGTIRSAALLGPWLLKTTRFAAANAMKNQTRRRLHEQAAALERSNPHSELHSQWQSIEPDLDSAIARLARADQTSLILRFFRGLSLREVGLAMGTTEEGARKRVTRAIARLRNKLSAKRANQVGCTDLAALLALHALESAPPHVVANATAATATVGISSAAALPGVFAMTAGTKIAASAAAAILLLAGSVAIVKLAGISLQTTPQVQLPAQPALQVVAAADEKKARVQAIYGLQAGEAAKYVPTPFTIERNWLYEIAAPDPSQSRELADERVIYSLPDGTFALGEGQFEGNRGGNGFPGWSVHVAARQMTKLRTWQIQGDDTLMRRNLPGYWVVRPDSSPDQVLQAVAAAASASIHRDMQFVHQRIEHEVVVAKGVRHELPLVNGRQPEIHLSLIADPQNNFALGRQWGGDTPGVAGMLDGITDHDTNVWFVDETTANSPDRLFYWYSVTAIDPASTTPPRQLDALLASLTEQTQLTYTRETRTVDIWTLQPR